MLLAVGLERGKMNSTTIAFDSRFDHVCVAFAKTGWMAVARLSLLFSKRGHYHLAILFAKVNGETKIDFLRVSQFLVS
jgi:hypothetical protein